MTKPSLEEFSSLVGDIYDAGVDGASWLPMLRRLNGLLSSHLSTVWMLEGENQFLDVHSVQHEHARDYVAHYRSLDVLVPAVMKTPTSAILTNAMVVAPADFVRTEFYNDFARRYDMYDCMVMRVFDSTCASGHISLARSERFGIFQPSDMRLLSLLWPHLQRAMQTRIRLAPSNIGPDAAVEALDRIDQGVLIVDAGARVAYANRAAEAMLAKGDTLGIERSGGRQLRAATFGQTRALRRLIKQASGEAYPKAPSGGVFRLLSDGGGTLLVSVTPLSAMVTWNAAQRPAVLVLLASVDQDTAPSPEHLRTLFDLTPAEVAVARRIVLGDGIQAAARTLRIAPATVHTHLGHIFDKTETSRQAELVRLLQQVARLN